MAKKRKYTSDWGTYPLAIGTITAVGMIEARVVDGYMIDGVFWEFEKVHGPE